MATKVDRTASMLCRRHGCSSEKITERMLEAEARVAELEAVGDRLQSGASRLGEYVERGDQARPMRWLWPVTKYAAT